MDRKEVFEFDWLPTHGASDFFILERFTRLTRAMIKDFKKTVCNLKHFKKKIILKNCLKIISESITE